MADGNQANFESEHKTWLSALPKAKLTHPYAYRIKQQKNLGNQRAILQLNTEMYDRVFQHRKVDADFDYVRRPAKVVLKHPDFKLWKPQTYDKTIYVLCVIGRKSDVNYSTGTPDGDYVDTVRVGPKVYELFDERRDQKGYVKFGIKKRQIPFMNYVLMRHPSDDWNLSIRFFYLSLLLGLTLTILSEAYEWPKQFRTGVDWFFNWLNATLATL